MAGANQSLGVAVNVQRSDEARLQVSRLVLHGEILLVVPHDCHQNLARKFQEPLFETACQGPRPFRGLHDPILERIVMDGAEPELFK